MRSASAKVLAPSVSPAVGVLPAAAATARSGRTRGLPPRPACARAATAARRAPSVAACMLAAAWSLRAGPRRAESPDGDDARTRAHTRSPSLLPLARRATSAPHDAGTRVRVAARRSLPPPPSQQRRGGSSETGATARRGCVLWRPPHPTCHVQGTPQPQHKFRVFNNFRVCIHYIACMHTVDGVWLG